MSNKTAGVRVWAGADSIEVAAELPGDSMLDITRTLQNAVGAVVSSLCTNGEEILYIEPWDLAATVLRRCARAGFAACEYPNAHAEWNHMVTQAAMWCHQTDEHIAEKSAPEMVQMLRSLADTLERENEGRARPNAT